MTVIVMSSLALSALSLAVKRRTYVPDAEKLAVVSTALALPKLTVPGPLTLLHVVVTAPGGLGRPSSVTVPSRLAALGSVIVSSAPALTTGAWFCGFTVIVTSSLALSALSLAVRRSTYVPDAEKLAVVSTALALPKATVPGPLTLLHVVVTAPGGLGRPSSVTVPSRVAEAGSVIVSSAPALTTGAWFCGMTVIVTSSLALSALSLAVKRRTYVPETEKLAVVSTALALPKVTVPGPLTLLHVVVTVPGGFGRPS